jgi:hypothetical protein
MPQALKGGRALLPSDQGDTFMRSLVIFIALAAVLYGTAQSHAALVCPQGSHSCGPTRGCCPAGSDCLPVRGCSVRPQDTLGEQCGPYRCRTGEHCITQQGQKRCLIQ